MSHRATKIIATLGPASSSEQRIRDLHESGADLFRLNFSHGTHQDHADRLRTIRAIEASSAHPIGVLLDLQGPKIRIGTFAEGKVNLVTGALFTFDDDPTPGDERRVSLPHPEIFEVMSPGDVLLIDDGRLRFVVTANDGRALSTEVLVGGEISNRKGVNVPGAILPMPAMSAKDHDDLRFGLEMGVDWVALSFVQRPEDVLHVRDLVRGRAKIMAKIEKPSAIEYLGAIIAASDAIMVARGDLGVELPPEDVPAIQKRIIRMCREAGKPVVVATQMLESMISMPTPTRAEVSDVAAAVYDGADAVMLSAESASGRYPREAVSVMCRIIQRAENDPLHRKLMNAVTSQHQPNSTDSIGMAVQKVAEIMPLAATISFTSSGATTLRIARLRPRSPIVSVTHDRLLARQLTLVWAVVSRECIDVLTFEDLVEQAAKIARAEGLNVEEAPLAIVAGMPFGQAGSTNLLRMLWPAAC